MKKRGIILSVLNWGIGDNKYIVLKWKLRGRNKRYIYSLII